MKSTEILTIKKQDKEPLVELVRSYLEKDKRTKEVVSRKEIHFYLYNRI